MSTYNEFAHRFVDVMKACRQEQLTAREISVITGLNKNCVHRMALALAEVGVLDRTQEVRTVGGICFKYRLSDSWAGK